MTRLVTTVEARLSVQNALANDIRDLLAIRDRALRGEVSDNVARWASSFTATFANLEKFVTEVERPRAYATDEQVASALHAARGARGMLYRELISSIPRP